MELLDFIHVFIEDPVELIDEALYDKRFRDYMEEHLHEKYNAEKVEEVVPFIDPELKVKHAIELFAFVTEKMRDRK